MNKELNSGWAGSLRALEIILNLNKMTTDLSEQYLYWDKKPKCQTSPCNE